MLLYRQFPRIYMAVHGSAPYHGAFFCLKPAMKSRPLFSRQLYIISPIVKRDIHCIAPFFRPQELYKSKLTNRVKIENSRQFSSRRRQHHPSFNPYEILGVDKNTTKKDIKLAYFRQAKKHHPDLNPGDAKAKERFQTITNAYEILSDDTKRAAYDNAQRGQQTGNNQWGDWFNSYQSQQQQQQRQHTSSHSSRQQDQQYQSFYQQGSTSSAEEIFRRVMQDRDVISEAITEFFHYKWEQAKDGAEAAQRGDWATARAIIKENSTLLVTVLLPSFFILRYPALIWPVVVGAGRLLARGWYLALVVLSRTGWGGVASLGAYANLIWEQIVRGAALKREQIRRERDRYRKERGGKGGGSGGSGGRSGGRRR